MSNEGMKIVDKVRGGTLRHDEDLCTSCSHASIREDDRGNKYVRCASFDRYVRTKTLSCTSYNDKTLPDFYEFQVNAWIYYPNIGFKKYAQLTRKEVEKLEAMGDD